MLGHNLRMPERPSWDTYFMQIAHLVATRATCPRRSVGAIVVKDKHIVATGYNGAPAGLPHCPPEGDKHEWPRGCLISGHCMRSLHAEQNCLLQAAKIGVACDRSTMYVTCQPCNTCAKMIINAGIQRVVYEGDYPDDFSLELFRDSRIDVYRYREGVVEAVEYAV